MMGKIRGNGISAFSNTAGRDGAIVGRVSIGLRGKTAGKANKSFSARGAFGTGDNQNMIEQRRHQGRKQATKIITDQFARDGKISDQIVECQDRQKEHVEDLSTINGFLNDVKKEIEALAKEYGVGENEDAVANPEYNERLKELEDRRFQLENMADQKLNSIGAESSSITAIKQVQAESQGMVDAENSANAVLEAVSDEITSMIWEEAKEYLDEKAKEEEEKAEKIAEQTKEQEEFIEQTKEKAEENEVQMEELSDTLKNQDELLRELEKIKKEQLLVDEDLKGLLLNKQY